MSVFKEVTDYNVDYEKLKEELCAARSPSRATKWSRRMKAT